MTATERLSEMVAKLSAELALFNVTIQKLEEIVNGTAKTGGLKERVAIAEEEIKRNKASFDKIGENITNLRNEMMLEIGKISSATSANAKQKGEFWRDIWQGMIKVAAGVVTAGVVGVVFWQLIIWLAAHAPTP
jgi:hypothetical protein